MDFKTVGIKISDELAETMEERGIKEEDIREVLEFAEGEGGKLYIEGENHFLGKKRINNFTANVEYSIVDDGVELINVYSHVVKLAAD
ncbi:MAG: hypothetical protein RR235_08550 [Oscillospiraceae bacterium]